MQNSQHTIGMIKTVKNDITMRTKDGKKDNFNFLTNTVKSLLRAAALILFSHLECGSYLRAALIQGRLLFQMYQFQPYKLSKLTSFLVLL